MKIYSIIKRVIDFYFALIGLALFSPLLLLFSILIRLNSKGPAFFRQERAGKDGKIFKIYKFRTMKSERFGKDSRELTDTERLTSVGKYIRDRSIDELPQLINILKGEMSFIGPRPLYQKYLPYYTNEEMRRHSIRPGVTGWAQINGRNLLSWNERFRLDVEYVDKMSLKFDLKILYLTIEKVLKKDNVVIREDNPMLDFDVERQLKDENIKVITG